MKKKWVKRILALGAAAMMLMGSMTAMAAEELTDAPTEATADYFKTLKDNNGVNLTGNPSLTISKYEYGTDGKADENKPIGGVKFKYAKVGNVYQAGNEVVYGINTDVAKAAGIDTAADYKHETMSFYKDYSVINQKVQASTSDKYNALTSVTLTEKATGADGKITGIANGYGLYLIIESDVSGAYTQRPDNKVAISKSQNPFIAAVPYFVEGTAPDNGYWVEAVDAKVKNSTTVADIEKKIITSDEYAAAAGTETGVDTDTADIGDTVYFHLKSKVPELPADGDDITKYVITDNISKGLTFDSDSVKVVTLVEGGIAATVPKKNYTVSGLTVITTPKEYAGGKSFTVTFEAEGLTALSELARSNPGKRIDVIVYCSAVLNQDAVIGPQGGGNAANSGNPNRVKLDYKVGQGSEIEMPWDVVTAFTFGIDVTKKLGDTTATTTDGVEFVLYQESGNNKTYYKFDPSAAGTYVVKTGEPSATDKTQATKMTVGTDGKILVKGLDEGTYYLEETATKDGYNLLLEPVKITMTAKRGGNTFVDPASNNDYLGILTENNDTDGKAELEIINTKGFRLPTTGGMGATIFAAIGILIVALGGVFYFVSSRKSGKR